MLLVATLGAILGGPALGDHETIVAECARNMRLTGDWLVPWFLDTPFMRKPPLPYWLTAGASYLFPPDPHTGLPVTASVARLPSALAGFGTVLLLWRLAAAMFGPRTGRVAALLACSSVIFLLYSPNATVEMQLTFCCTWAYLHFWFAVTARTSARQRLHLVLFYVALGLGMLAKGPAPLAMVAVPLAVWWYAERPLRVLARMGPLGIRLATASFLRGLKRRTIRALTDLWLLPGLVVFAIMFVPWMVAVAFKYPHSWDMWNWQYVQRAEGDYLDTRPRGMFYYLPIIAGLTAPWLFLLPEAVLAPWITRYRHHRRPLLYAGLWVLVAVVIMSLEPFKKPYYVVPAAPGLILLMAVVAERFYSGLFAPRQWLQIGLGLMAAGLIAGVIVGWVIMRKEMPQAATRVTLIAAAAACSLMIAGVLYVRDRGWAALGLTAATAVVTFQAVWHFAGSAIDNVDKVAALARLLDEAGVPREARVLWADKRPDARLGFYYGHNSGYLIPPAEIVSLVVDRTRAKEKLLAMAVERARKHLSDSTPVYLIVQREHYGFVKMQDQVPVHLIGFVHEPGDPPKKDWMVVTNVVPASQAAP